MANRNDCERSRTKRTSQGEERVLELVAATLGIITGKTVLQEGIPKNTIREISKQKIRLM